MLAELLAWGVPAG